MLLYLRYYSCLVCLCLALSLLDVLSSSGLASLEVFFFVARSLCSHGSLTHSSDVVVCACIRLTFLCSGSFRVESSLGGSAVG